MKEDFVLQATARDVKGKGASRRLRREAGMLPAIIYGDDKAPVMITLEHKELLKHLEHESFYSHVITINLENGAESVILKDLQRHPASPKVLHADFLRVSNTKKISVNVPLHFINEESSKGVKTGGGIASHSMTELEVSCLAKDLPEFIEVDVKDVDVGEIVHISDVKLPAGVESVALSHGEDHDLPIFTINKPKGSANEEADSEETPAE